MGRGREKKTFNKIKVDHFILRFIRDDVLGSPSSWQALINFSFNIRKYLKISGGNLQKGLRICFLRKYFYCPWKLQYLFSLD